MYRIGAVTLFACSWFSLSVLAAPVGGESGVEVEVIQPTSTSLDKTLLLTGSIEAKHNANIAVQQAGLVQSLSVDIGDSVTKGQTLLQLDDRLATYQLREFQAAVSSAQIQLAEASRLHQEVLALSKTQVVPVTLIAERKAAVAAAEALLIRQQASLGLQQERVVRHSVVAPFDGVIAQRNADIGEWVQPQTSVFNLVSNTDLRLRLAVPQEYFGQLQQGESAVRILADGHSRQAFDLNLSHIVAVSDAVTRTFIVLVDLPPDPQLIAGMSANASIQLSAQDEALLWLPKSAIKAHPDGGSSVFSVSNNRAMRHIVTIQQRRNDQVAVTGAPAGRSYVAKGVELLKHLDEVQVRAKP